jgi:hypothetical protein
VDEIKALVKKVDRENAKPADVEKLRQVLRHGPAAGVDFQAEITPTTYRAVIASMQHTALEGIAIERTCEKKKADLGYANASPMEKMLIDAVVLTWLRYTQVERSAASVWGGSHTSESGAYWDKRLSAAQRRYLRAIETLARVRRLALPMLQVNIAEKQQVNN